MERTQQERDRVCPPIKFVFRRYRAAIKKQQQQRNNNTNQNDQQQKRFQIKHRTSILDPWDETEPTGYVYRTTLKEINKVYCEQPF